MPVSYKEIRTWKDLLEALKEASPEQLEQPVQTVKSHPCDDFVFELCPGICIATVDEMDLLYVRSCTDNRRHGEHLAIYVDYNPHGEDGAIAYEGFCEEEEKPIYPKDYDDSQNWTGPAQKLVDAGARDRIKNKERSEFSQLQITQIQRSAENAKDISMGNDHG